MPHKGLLRPAAYSDLACSISVSNRSALAWVFDLLVPQLRLKFLEPRPELDHFEVAQFGYFLFYILYSHGYILSAGHR
jgi:hypothetical protein